MNETVTPDYEAPKLEMIGTVSDLTLVRGSFDNDRDHVSVRN